MTTSTRPMTHSERGAIGNRKRWGERRVIRIDALDPAVARAVRALIAADEAARRQSEDGPSAA